MKDMYHQNLMKAIQAYYEEGLVSEKLFKTITGLFVSYSESIQEDPKSNIAAIYENLAILLREVKNNYTTPYSFELYHKKVKDPFDYQSLGIRFVLPLICFHTSKILGQFYFNEMAEHLENRHNVIIFANHQTELDPQVIYTLSQDLQLPFISDIIFVAGHKVTTDPMAIPFSMGCNLLCIYSKKYIENPPEEREKKQWHNQRTMRVMLELLKEGGKCICVFPSGGRDRTDSQGVVQLDVFDPQNIEMFYLIAKKSKTPTHFYPMALDTYTLMPPPKDISDDLVEARFPTRAKIGIHCGKEIEMENLFCHIQHKEQKRLDRSQHIWKEVCRLYQEMLNL